MIEMLQAVVYRVYHNEATMLKAKSLMNAVRNLLEEIPPLLEKADEESDGFHTYHLLDRGKQMYNLTLLIEGQVRKNRRKKAFSPLRTTLFSVPYGPGGGSGPLPPSLQFF